MNATPQHIATIHRFLDALARRERAIIGARAALIVGAAGVGALLAGSMAFSSGLRRGSVGLGLAAGVLPVLLLLFFRRFRPQWRRAGVLRWQARKVEARLPGLRSRMITVIDRSVDVAQERAHFSTELWARAAEHAQAAVGLISVGDVHAWSRTRRPVIALLVLTLCSLLAGSVLPVGPLDALDILMGKSAAAVRLQTASAATEDDALVGDITLRYIYPDYMGMDSVQVPNSDGTIHAPPGTRVQISARTAEPFDAAAIQIDHQEPLDAVLTQSRDLQADVTVQIDGAWRFLLFSGDSVSSSADFKIIVEADQPPVVVADTVGEAARAVDEPIGFRWQVTDDYGIASVGLELVRDGETETIELRTPIDPVPELSGSLRQTPRQLGLSPGDTVTLRIAAMDSDKASGGNRGVSEDIVLQVLGPKGVGRRLTEYHRKLREALLLALADFLEEPVPPAERAQGMLRWARQTRGRLDPVREVYQAQWGEEQSTSIDGVVVREVLDHSGRLYRFALVTFDTSSSSALSGRKALDKDYSTFVELHSETVAALERAVWVIDEMLQQVSYRQIASMVKSLASEAEQLAELAQSTSDAQALLARLDRLERLMSRLKEESARLSEGQFKEFLNSQMGEADGRMDAIRKAIAEGRLEDAQRMLAELSEQLQRFAEGMQEQMSKSGQDDNELAERLEKLMGDLDSLSADQDALAEELAQAREEHGGELSEVMAQWERLDALAAQAVDRSVVVLARVGDGGGFAASTVRNAEVLGQSVRGSRDAVQARDAESALDRVRDAQRYSRFTGRPRGSGKEVLKPELRRLDTPLAEMESILQRLMDMPRTSSPELQAAAQQLSAQQSQIKARQEQLAQEVQTVERAIPAADGSAQKHMAGAGEAMDDAASALGQGEAMAGEGHQRAAKRKVDQTKQSLQQAQQRQQQMQQQMQRMEGEGEGKAGEGEQPPGPPMASPEIPTPEAFKTPEAYRRALLEGMAEDVPDEFKALKKRFYEELVRQ